MAIAPNPPTGQPKPNVVTDDINQDMYPFMVTAISKNNGIDIRGKFYTSDDAAVNVAAGTAQPVTEPGAISYITVGRNGSNSFPSEGLGFAWKISTQVPLTYDAYGVPATYQVDYNCYIVDNSSMQADTYISKGNLVTDFGVNNYAGGNTTLTYGKYQIVPYTWYGFRIRITSNYEITVWIVPDGTDISNDSNFKETSASVNSSTGIPTNVGGWVIKKSSTDPAYTPNATGSYFGLGVMGTKGHHWRYSNIVVKSITQDYIGNHYKLYADAAELPDGQAFRVFWRGWGEWTIGATTYNGASLFIFNQTTAKWALVGTTSGSRLSIDPLITVDATLPDIKDYRDGNKYVSLLAVPNYASSTSTINTDYVSISNTATSGIHVGGMIDIYVNAPDKIVNGVISLVVPSNGKVIVNTTNGFTLPVQEITAITLSTLELTRGTDYTITVLDSKYGFSTQPYWLITFDPAYWSTTVKIAFNYYADGTSVQAFVDSDAHRNPGTSTLVKIKPPAIITINKLDYKGTVEADSLKTSIASWINALTTTFEVTDLINFLYTSMGVTYIRLSTLDITYRDYDEQGNILHFEEPVVDSLALTGLQAFYSSATELYGVNKLG